MNSSILLLIVALILSLQIYSASDTNSSSTTVKSTEHSSTAANHSSTAADHSSTTPAHLSSTTVHPNSTTPCPDESHERHFDSPSFFGGMVLMFGLIIIAYFARNYYITTRDTSHGIYTSH